MERLQQSKIMETEDKERTFLLENETFFLFFFLLFQQSKKYK